MLRCIGFVIIVLAVTACAHSSTSALVDEESKVLGNAISALSTSIKVNEAHLISTMLVTSTSELEDEYRIVSPPRYHNLLVHLGLRKRGLCCHWVEDLRSRLGTIDQQSIQFDWLVTNQGSPLREHHSLVVYASNSSWEQGLIFDPWRNSGQPYWVQVEKDTYAWKAHPLSGKWDLLHCK